MHMAVGVVPGSRPRGLSQHRLPHPVACPSSWRHPLLFITHSALQGKFEERWQALMAPRLAEEELAARGDEGTVLHKRMEAHQVGAAAHGAAL